MRRAGLVLLLVPHVSFAAGVTLPHTFSNDQVADANAVNQNFATLATEIDARDAVGTAYEKAQGTMSGGGTVDWGGPGNRLKWSARFIVIPVQRPGASSSGYVDVVQPTTDLPAANVYDGVARSATTAGVLLNAWEALYAVHAVGGANTAVTYRIVRYTHDFTAAPNWLLVAAVNGDDGTVRLGTGAILRRGERFVEGMKELPRMSVWSGGCASHGMAAGWNTYCLNGVDFDKTNGAFSVNPDGTITFNRAGFYRVTFYWLAYGSQGGSAHARFLKNGTTIFYSHNTQAVTNQWYQEDVTQVWPFNAGDTLVVQANNPGSYAYHSWNGNGLHSRLQVEFAGQL